MASSTVHRAKAEHNESFFTALNSECASALQQVAGELGSEEFGAIRGQLEAVATTIRRFPDWQVTGLFYAALHLVDAFLATVGVHPQKHYEPNAQGGRGRNQQVQRHLGSIYDPYRNLDDLSRRARYRPESAVTPQHLGEAWCDYQAVKQEVEGRISPPEAVEAGTPA